MADSKYDEKFNVPENFRRLSSWTEIAKTQILRYLNDEEFYRYISTEVMKNDENPPGPFTRFLYWFGLSCQAGWGTMIDFSDRYQRIYLCDKYYKWMHKLRDELIAVEESNEEVKHG